MSDSDKKKDYSWSDVDESPVIPTAVPAEEPPTVDLSASVSSLSAPAVSADNTSAPAVSANSTVNNTSESPSEPHNHSSPSEPTNEAELNQEMINKLLDKLMDDIPPLVDDDMPPLVDDMPELVYDEVQVYDTPSCPRCEAALQALLSGPVRRRPVINVESEEESEDSEEESEDDSDSDYVPSESDESSVESDPPTPRTLADREVNVPSAIQYITVILAIVYLLKFYIYMNESHVRYRPCT